MQTERDSLMHRGTNALREGDYNLAETLFSALVELEPGDLDARLLLGIVAAKTGNEKVAIGSLQSVIAADPANLQALSALSHLLRVKGQTSEALELARRAVANSPNDAPAQHSLGRCYLALGELSEAKTHLTRAVTLNPRIPAVHQDLATLLQREGRIGDAAAALEHSIALAPKDPEGHALLAHLFLSYGNFEGAVACLRHAYELEPNTARGLTRLAFALTESGQNEEAESAARAAITMAPKSADAIGLLGRLLQNKGEFAEAEECLEQAILLDPSKLGAHYRLVIGRKIGEADRALIGRMEHILERLDLTDAERALIEYSLGKSYDDLGEYEAAIRHFDEANRLELKRLQSSGRHYDVQLHRDEVELTKQAYTADLFARYAGLGSSSETPVFIVGMERSGTSLVEQMLSSHPQIGGAGELPFWGRKAPIVQNLVLGSEAPGPRGLQSEFALIAEEYLQVLALHGKNKLRVTDKMPKNLAFLGQIHLVFPKARIIWCLRDPVDNCLSIYLTAFRAGTGYLNDRGNIVQAYRRHSELLEHWRSVLPADCLFEVRYEDLVAETERVAHEMFSFLGLDWDDSCLRHETNARGVKTPSVWQARQPIYRTSVERWRNYEPWLGEFETLRDRACDK